MISSNFLRRYTAQVFYIATFPWSTLGTSSSSFKHSIIPSASGKSIINSRAETFRSYASLRSFLPAFVDTRSNSVPTLFGKVTKNDIITSTHSLPIESTSLKMASITTSSKSSNRVALLQFEVTSNKSQNLKTAKDYITQAQNAGASLCVLPEIWNSPYATSAFGDYAETLPDIGDSLDASDKSKMETWGPSSNMLMELAQSTNMYIVGGSIPELFSEKLYNTCLVINPRGEIVGKHRKVHLFDVDVPGGICFKESETLSAGDGATFFDVEGLGRIGVGICYDIRFPEYALLLTQIHKCKILVYPGAFNLTTGPAHWELLQRARAVDGQCYVLTASPARMPPPPADDSEESHEANKGDGTEKKKYPHYSAWGHSTAVSPWGEVIATCEEGPAMVIADLDMAKVEEMRMAIPTMAQKRKDLYNLVDGIGNP